jgi:hypothetical protein
MSQQSKYMSQGALWEESNTAFEGETNFRAATQPQHLRHLGTTKDCLSMTESWQLRRAGESARAIYRKNESLEPRTGRASNWGFFGKKHVVQTTILDYVPPGGGCKSFGRGEGPQDPDKLQTEGTKSHSTQPSASSCWDKIRQRRSITSVTAGGSSFSQPQKKQSNALALKHTGPEAAGPRSVHAGKQSGELALALKHTGPEAAGPRLVHTGKQSGEVNTSGCLVPPKLSRGVYGPASQSADVAAEPRRGPFARTIEQSGKPTESAAVLFRHGPAISSHTDPPPRSQLQKKVSFKHLPPVSDATKESNQEHFSSQHCTNALAKSSTVDTNAEALSRGHDPHDGTLDRLATSQLESIPPSFSTGLDLERYVEIFTALTGSEVFREVQMVKSMDEVRFKTKELQQVRLVHCLSRPVSIQARPQSRGLRIRSTSLGDVRDCATTSKIVH